MGRSAGVKAEKASFPSREMENRMKNVANGALRKARALMLAGVAVGFAIPTVVEAQDAASETDTSFVDDTAAAEGNAIIVTATKRESTLQDVPVAVTVTTAETLERGQIRDLRDLQTVVPSLSVGQRQSVGSTNFFIRGFGNGANNAGIEPSVGVFVDNVYRSRTVSQITDLPDVQRIEVLRGPQSTLFGKNASAGVISISTLRPQDDYAASAEVTYGNFDQIIAKGYVTGPMADGVAGSLAFGINKRDGYYRDAGTGDRSNERDRWFVRGQVLVDASDNLTLRFIGDYDKIDENCCAVSLVQGGPPLAAIRAVGGSTNAPGDPFSGLIYNNFNSTNDISNAGVSMQADLDLGDFTLTSISAYRDTRSDTVQDADFSSANLIYPLSQFLDIGSFTQEFRVTGRVMDRVDVLLGAFYMNEQVTSNGQLLYATQFRPYVNLLVQQASGGALSLPTIEAALGASDGRSYAGQFMANGQGFTESYDLDSSALSLFGQVDIELTDRLVLTLGGNYTRDRKTFVTDAVSTDVFSSINLDAPQYAAFRRTLLLQGGVARGVGTALGLGRDATAAEVTSFATSPTTAPTYAAIATQAGAFAVANQNNPLANPLGALRGLQFLPPFVNVPNTVEDGKTRDNDFGYTARLAYDVNDVLNVYLSYATGFKASSINLSRDSRPAPADRAGIEAAGLSRNNLVYGSRFAGPEDSRVIEAGMKANFGDVSANLAVFNQVISGFQSNIFTGSGFALRNAGKQRTNGVEFESSARLGDLTLNGAVTYLDPTFVSFVQSSVGDLSGTRPAGVPEFTAVIGAQYELDLGHARLVPRVSFLWQSETQVIEGLPAFLVKNPDGSIASNTAALAAAVPFTSQVNDLTASLSYELNSGLSATIWGRNLLDDRNLGVVFDSPAQPGNVSGYPTDPRTYGVTLRYKI
jgi:outer membrane receptor protein involved in Fe transport